MRAMCLIFITTIQKMGRKRTKGTKYSRVTKQQKYIFLKLCISEKQSIHQAAFNSGIHYSTAKTILFFHKKQYKNYTTYIVKDPNTKCSAETAVQATYREISINVDQVQENKSKIQLIVNSKSKRIYKRNGKKKNKNCLTLSDDDCENIIKLQDRSFQNYQGEKNSNSLHEDGNAESQSNLKQEQSKLQKVQSPLI